MVGSVLCLATLTMAMDVGWRQLPDGGMEYILQIEPHLLDSLRSGSDIVSNIPPNVRDLRKYRITVGTGELPRDVPVEPPPEEPSSPFPEPMDTAGRSSPQGSRGSEFSWAQAPQTLPTSNDVQPLDEFPERRTGFVQSQQTGSEPAGEQADREEPPEAGTPEDKPGALSLTLAAVSASCVGGMLFLGWVAWDYRRQYHLLLRRVLDESVDGLALDDLKISEAERQAASS